VGRDLKSRLPASYHSHQHWGHDLFTVFFGFVIATQDHGSILPDAWWLIGQALRQPHQGGFHESKKKNSRQLSPRYQPLANEGIGYEHWRVGGAANVYINLQGREPTRPLGAIRRSAKPDRKRLQGDQRSVTNEQVFEIILKKPRAEDILQKKSNFGSDQAKRRRGERDFHVFSEDAGDVLIVTIPGYHLDFNAGTGASAGDFFQPSTFFGQHGYDPRRPEMKAIFYGAGPSFKSKTVKEVNNVDVPPSRS
jgi:hypothetical protein